ncbi:distal membrane arm assembly component 2 [Leptinotarsa decemlineata]|uniref:distal membrane arm assembly component 2 n=1 Tax=Leptinotarsa decemlineata TaxID=7539 RepID=UPI000C251CF7|nr:distal membrane-arm assembly complex protein 2 [Leptinotarsa decemlineata]
MYKFVNGSRFTRQSVLRQCCCGMSKNSDTEDPGKALVVKDLRSKLKESNSVTSDQMQWRTSWHQEQGEHYSFLRTFYKESNNRSLLQKIQSPIDFSPSGIKKWWGKKVDEYEIISQSYIPERHQILGNELAAAHFIVYRGGAVKFFNEDKWIKANEYKEYSLPRHYQTDKYLQAIDCSNMNLRYEGLVNIRGLKKVEWLSLNGCDNMDDWCLDTISNIFSHSLLYLDLRNCPKITYRGIGALYKMQNLKILYLDDFLKSTVYELTCLMLQEVNPDLDIKSDPVTFEIS